MLGVHRYLNSVCSYRILVASVLWDEETAQLH